VEYCREATGGFGKRAKASGTFDRLDIAASRA